MIVSKSPFDAVFQLTAQTEGAVAQSVPIQTQLGGKLPAVANAIAGIARVVALQDVPVGWRKPAEAGFQSRQPLLLLFFRLVMVCRRVLGESPGLPVLAKAMLLDDQAGDAQRKSRRVGNHAVIFTQLAGKAIDGEIRKLFGGPAVVPAEETDQRHAKLLVSDGGVTAVWPQCPQESLE